MTKKYDDDGDFDICDDRDKKCLKNKTAFLRHKCRNLQETVLSMTISEGLGWSNPKSTEKLKMANK